jgi:hypothetical protein
MRLRYPAIRTHVSINTECFSVGISGVLVPADIEHQKRQSAARHSQ